MAQWMRALVRVLAHTLDGVTTACNPLLASTGNSTLVTYNTHIQINGNMVLKKKMIITFKLNHLNSSTLQEHE